LPSKSVKFTLDSTSTDYSENLADAIDTKKAGIFVFFHMEECPFCQKMRRNVFTQKPNVDQTMIRLFLQQNLMYKVIKRMLSE
jgi:thioredoxin-related protein